MLLLSTLMYRGSFSELVFSYLIFKSAELVYSFTNQLTQVNFSAQFPITYFEFVSSCSNHVETLNK